MEEGIKNEQKYIPFYSLCGIFKKFLLRLEDNDFNSRSGLLVCIDFQGNEFHGGIVTLWEGISLFRYARHISGPVKINIVRSRKVYNLGVNLAIQRMNCYPVAVVQKAPISGAPVAANKPSGRERAIKSEPLPGQQLLTRRNCSEPPAS